MSTRIGETKTSCPTLVVSGSGRYPSIQGGVIQGAVYSSAGTAAYMFGL
jgi:hypothetical protein